MSGRLVGEVVDWLQTEAADGLTTAEAAILLVIAERAHDRTRDMWRHRIDDYPLYERLKRATRLSDAGLSKALQRLARRGLECRVPIGTNKHGKPVFAAKGHSMQFRLPELPASVSLPDAVDTASDAVDTAPEAVDNPPGEGVDNSSPAAQRSDSDPTYEPKPGPESDLRGPKVGRTSAPNTSREIPSTTDPSSQYLSSQPQVEEPRDTARDPTDDLQHDYAEAHRTLQRLPDLGSALLEQARKLTPTASLREQVIIAARLAAKETA